MRGGGLATAAFVTALLTLTSDAQPSHRVVRITDPAARNPNEVSVAINPREPNTVIAVSRARGSGTAARSTNFIYVSRDGGLTWKTTPAQNPEQRTQGDDAVTIDSEGTAYHSYISFKGLRVERPKDAVNGIFVTSSLDGGATWKPPVAIVDHANTVAPFEDKPYLVADTAQDSPFRRTIYVAWTRFSVYGSASPNDTSQIYLSRSDDAGASFAMPFRVSDTGGDALDGDNTVEGAVPAVGTKGEVYLTWAGPKGLVFDKSTDGGWIFGEDKTISQLPGGWDIDVPGMNRHNGMPVTAVDHSQGSYRGSLYVNWIDQRNGDPDVFVMASRDGGATWGAPVRVNDDPVGNGKAQMFTWMAVDRVDGSINVVFYDRRNLEGTKTGVMLARSTDGGRTFRNYPIDLAPFDCNKDVFFGDYTGISAHGGRVVAAFMHFLDREEMAISAAVFTF